MGGRKGQKNNRNGKKAAPTVDGEGPVPVCIAVNDVPVDTGAVVPEATKTVLPIPAEASPEGLPVSSGSSESNDTGLCEQKSAPEAVEVHVEVQRELSLPATDPDNDHGVGNHTTETRQDNADMDSGKIMNAGSEKNDDQQNTNISVTGSNIHADDVDQTLSSMPNAARDENDRSEQMCALEPTEQSDTVVVQNNAFDTQREPVETATAELKNPVTETSGAMPAVAVEPCTIGTTDDTAERVPHLDTSHPDPDQDIVEIVESVLPSGLAAESLQADVFEETNNSPASKDVPCRSPPTTGEALVKPTDASIEADAGDDVALPVTTVSTAKPDVNVETSSGVAEIGLTTPIPVEPTDATTGLLAEAEFRSSADAENTSSENVLESKNTLTEHPEEASHEGHSKPLTSHEADENLHTETCAENDEQEDAFTPTALGVVPATLTLPNHQFNSRSEASDTRPDPEYPLAEVVGDVATDLCTSAEIVPHKESLAESAPLDDAKISTELGRDCEVQQACETELSCDVPAELAPLAEGKTFTDLKCDASAELTHGENGKEQRAANSTFSESGKLTPVSETDTLPELELNPNSETQGAKAEPVAEAAGEVTTGLCSDAETVLRKEISAEPLENEKVPTHEHGNVSAESDAEIVACEEGKMEMVPKPTVVEPLASKTGTSPEFDFGSQNDSLTCHEVEANARAAEFLNSVDVASSHSAVNSRCNHAPDAREREAQIVNPTQLQQASVADTGDLGAATPMQVKEPQFEQPRPAAAKCGKKSHEERPQCLPFVWGYLCGGNRK